MVDGLINGFLVSVLVSYGFDGLISFGFGFIFNLRYSVLVLYGFGFLVSYGFVCIRKFQGSIGCEEILI